MKKKGFTYMEVMVAFGIFAIAVVFILQLNHSAISSIRQQDEKMQMIHAAQEIMEKYKYETDNNIPVNQIYEFPIDQKKYYYKITMTSENKTKIIDCYKGNNKDVTVTALIRTLTVDMSKYSNMNDSVRVQCHLPDMEGIG